MSPSSVTCVNGKLEVPNNPIIPVIIGDGIGLDVTPVAVSYTHLTLPTTPNV